MCVHAASCWLLLIDNHVWIYAFAMLNTPVNSRALGRRWRRLSVMKADGRRTVSVANGTISNHVCDEIEGDREIGSDARASKTSLNHKFTARVRVCAYERDWESRAKIDGIVCVVGRHTDKRRLCEIGTTCRSVRWAHYRFCRALGAIMLYCDRLHPPPPLLMNHHLCGNNDDALDDDGCGRATGISTYLIWILNELHIWCTSTHKHIINNGSRTTLRLRSANPIFCVYSLWLTKHRMMRRRNGIYKNSKSFFGEETKMKKIPIEILFGLGTRASIWPDD